MDRPERWRACLRDIELAVAAAACIGAVAWLLSGTAAQLVGPASDRQCATITEDLAQLAWYVPPHHPAKGANAPFALNVRHRDPGAPGAIQ